MVKTVKAALRPAAAASVRGAALVACLVVAWPAPAAAAGIVARRAAGPVRLDGRLDDDAWRDAPVFADFVESFPRAGVPASFRTEVRVVYDDATLYVGVRCLDPDPGAIVRQLARRDSDTTSDRVEIGLDTRANGHSAYLFSVNAAGVLRDQLLFADVNSTDSWDAVWDAAVSRDGEGWSAELAVPFRQLRFSRAREGEWAIVVRRHVPRTHQVFDSTLVPREANPITAGGLVVSRFGRLDGIQDVEPRRGVEILPYVAARATLRPQYSDPRRPEPRLVDPALDIGLDFRTTIARTLTLTGAVNPDFGQVETDQVIQNLSNAEPFFPEKRPFFLEGLDLFQPVGSEYGSPQQLFYSRRIGLDAPILGAVKVTGAVREGLHVGVLDSIVMGAGNASLVPIGYSDPSAERLAPYEEHPDRRWRFRASQPFHFGPENALPSAHPVTTNYFAGVARKAIGGATAGATFTAATPLEPRCVPREFASDAEYLAAGCAASGANAAGLDVNVPGEWGGFAQVEASQAVGGPPAGRVLQDGTVLRPGDVGLGGHLRAGKLGGEPWRYSVIYVYEDAKLDLNRVGFQPLSNYQWADLDLHYVRPNGFGPFHAFQVDYLLDLNWSADGKGLPRGVNTALVSKVQLPGYQTVGLKLGLEIPQYDTREIPRAGVPFERTGDAFVALIFGSDPNRQLQASGDVFVLRTIANGAFPSESGWGLDLAGSWRPHHRLETRLDASYGRKPQGPRWVDTTADGVAVFSAQHPEFVSLTLRQQVVFTPRLTAQLYAQLFSSAIQFDPVYYGAALAGRHHLSPDELAPVAYAGSPASHDAVLNLNAVVRWEYRLGSTLFFVFTRSQSELPPASGVPEPGIASPSLFRGPAIQTLLVKWSYWWDR